MAAPVRPRGFYAGDRTGQRLKLPEEWCEPRVVRLEI
jgi:hypothetical protein